ncbi:MAG: hypothetical protein V4760_05990 [Bdellovibrionota bacterium]
MKTALFLSALAAVFFSAPPAAAQSAKNAGKTIVCQELGFHDETGEDVPLANIQIHLGAQGKAERVVVKRPKTDELAAIRATTLTLANAKISHSIDKNDSEIDDVSGKQILDPETGRPQYKWNIEDVETINAKAGDLSVTVLINDHLYAGRPGSVIAISKGDKFVISSGQGMVGCTGAVMFPGDKGE